jgi:hypothetical protein
MDASIEKQTEINEWSYNLKRDTLFFFQLVFIGLTFIVILFWIASTGIIGDMVAIYIMIIIFVILGGIWYSRYMYTRNNRDKLHWNKNVFPEDGKKPSPLPANLVASVATSTIENCKATKSSSESNKDVSWANPGSGSDNNDNYGMFDENEPRFRASWPESGLDGSAAARDASGALYGDNANLYDFSGPSGRVVRKSDGQVGFWDTTGGGFVTHPEDVVDRNLNDLFLRQGQDYNSIATGRSGVRVQDSVAYCEAHQGANDPATGVPCKRVWCMANPDKKWKDRTTSAEVECRTLFPELA